MRRFKTDMPKQFLLILFALVIAIILILSFCGTKHPNCFRSWLTTEEGEYFIDERFIDCYGSLEGKAGVLIRSIEICPHGKLIQLAVYPAEGIYRGKIVQ